MRKKKENYLQNKQLNNFTKISHKKTNCLKLLQKVEKKKGRRKKNGEFHFQCIYESILFTPTAILTKKEYLQKMEG